MGSKTRNTAHHHHRSRIIDNFLTKFKKVVNSATVPDKISQVENPTMASLLNPAAILAPPAALPHNTPPPSSAPISFINPHLHHHHQLNQHTCQRPSVFTSSTTNTNNRLRCCSGDSAVASSSSGSASSSVSDDDRVGSGGVAESSASSPRGIGQPVHPERREATDFIFGKIIGEGSFSTVYLAKDIHNRREYAIKVCMKSHIIRERKVEQIRREREILSLLSSNTRTTAPFFVKIYSSFQDNQRLYFVLSFAKHGELFAHINKVGSFDTACTRFYAAEILHALEHMHSLGIVHRDLKPENILLDENMHIQITDFGSAKMLSNSSKPDSADEEAVRRNSFVGTAQYISPELLSDSSECSRASDLWAFGAIIYQMVAGLPPFRSNSEYLIFRKIKVLDYEFPDGFCPKAKDLVQKLLVLEPKDRLGAQDSPEMYSSIRAHPFFEGIQFETLYKQTPPAIYPYLPGSSASESELRSQYRVPDNLEPGLDDRQITRLLGLELQEMSCNDDTNHQREDTLQARQRTGHSRGNGSANAISYALNASEQDLQMRLAEQKERDPRWHALCENNLILKMGIVNKRKGLFARRRMLMLTLGPHLYYADPDTMQLKGEIPWSAELRVEPKNFKIFFVHTPDRTYYLHDPDGYALEWRRAIEEVRLHYFSNSSDSRNNTT